MKTATIEETLYTLEQQLARSTKRADENFLQTILADSFTEFGASGRIFSKTDIIALLASESSFTDYDLKHFTLRPLSDDTVHVTYEIPPRTLTDGAVRAGSLRSSIWSCKTGDWRLLFHQGTLRP